MKNKDIVVLLAVVWLSTSGVIVDYGFEDYTQDGNYVVQKNIEILPERQVRQDYYFPKGCQVVRELSRTSNYGCGTQVTNYSKDRVNQLKEQFMDLLKLSDKIQKLSIRINEMNEFVKNTGEFNSSVVEDRINQLVEDEAVLKNSKQQIRIEENHLQSLIGKGKDPTTNNYYLHSSLNYQIQMLVAKLKKLNQMKQSLRDGKQSVDNFGRLSKDFYSENQLLGTLSNIMQNFNKIQELKRRIRVLENKIQARDIVIEDKRICQQEKEKIKGAGKNEQIRKLMSSLRIKKKTQIKGPNQYCEGVAKKLEDEIKRVLSVYNYYYGCARDLNEIIDARRIENQEKAKLEKELQDLLNNNEIESLKEKILYTQSSITKTYRNIDSYAKEQYQHDPQKLKELIAKTTLELQNARQQQRKLPPIKSMDSTNQLEIKELISKIKRMKAQYCKRYDQYQQKVNYLRSGTHRIEESIKFDRSMGDSYKEMLAQLEKHQAEFRILKQRIMANIK